MTHKQAYLKKRAQDPLPLDEETKKKYLENPYDCPFCDSDNLRGEEYDGEGGEEVWRKIHCDNCGAIWREFYALSDMELLKASEKVKPSKETKDWEKRWHKRSSLKKQAMMIDTDKMLVLSAWTKEDLAYELDYEFKSEEEWQDLKRWLERKYGSHESGELDSIKELFRIWKDRREEERSKEERKEKGKKWEQRWQRRPR